MSDTDRASDERLRAVAVTAQDERAEIALRRRESLFSAILEAAPDAVVAVDREGRIVHANAQTEKLFGHPRATLLGSPVETLVPKRLRHGHEAHRASYATDARVRGMGSGLELFAVRGDGSEFPVEVSLSPVQTDEGVLVLAAIRDVTDRKKAEGALREQNALYQSVLGALNETGEGVVINDGPRYVWANEAFARMLGYTVDEILALPSHLPLIPPDNRAEQDQRLQARLAGVLPDHGEVTMLHKSGRLVQVEFGTRPLRAGDPGRRLTVVRDVTERKQMQARVILGDRMASVGTLAAGVAHEINNPLAYVMANLDMIAEEVRAAGNDPLGPRMRDLETMVNEARQGAERVRRIVRGLRTFSRADEERRVLLDVRSVLELSINMTFNEIKHRARLVKDYGEIRPVEADETRLGQVFINLLVNAAQAIPEGQADRNEIRLITRLDASGRIVVEVKDTGRGIPPNAIGRIFDPFFTTKEIGEGTGLGLSICHGIVTGLGGEISVESVQGKGSTFRVALPAATLEPVLPRREPAASLRPAGSRAGRILVIDDDPMVGTTLARVLGKEHEVTVFTDGKRALDVIHRETRPFDVILCDLMMPVMTGMDLYEELKRTMPDTAERMVFITGGAFTPAARVFLDTVANQRLEKPFAPQNLRALVRGLIR